VPETIFGEISFIFKFCELWIGDKVTPGLGFTYEKVKGENKMLKDECESFYNQIIMNHLS
jgi:hypothetical protein